MFINKYQLTKTPSRFVWRSQCKQEELPQSWLQINSCTKERQTQSQHTILKTNIRMHNEHIFVYSLTTHLNKYRNEQLNEQCYRHYGVGNTTTVMYL